MVTDIAERAQEARDLRRELAGLTADPEVVFKDTSPRQPKVTLWRLRDGREVRIPQHRLDETLAKRDRQGNYLFVGRKADAPAFKRGKIKCFLHAESPDRPLLDELGIVATCPMATLPNEYNKRLHGEHRHGAAWEMFQEAKKAAEERRREERAESQIAATLRLAEAAAGKAKKNEAV